MFEWKRLRTDKKATEDEPLPPEFERYPISAFERDYHAIASSVAFRSLQDKTQVFPLAKSDYVRTRLTHSIEVSTIAKQLAEMCFRNTSDYQLELVADDEADDEHKSELRTQRIFEIESILSCAGLLHDLGNPPFGHIGEAIISEWFASDFNRIALSHNSGDRVWEFLSAEMREDFLHFDGNAQTLRLLLKKKTYSGMNEPFSVICTLVKYPTVAGETGNELIRKKIGIFQSEKNAYFQIANELGIVRDEKVLRHPLTYLLEAADDIAYRTADLEDAVKTGIIKVKELGEFLREELNRVGTEESTIHFQYAENDICELEKSIERYDNPTQIMREWSGYIRWRLMYVAYWRFSYSYQEIMNGEFRYDLFHDTNHSLTHKLLELAMKEFVYDSNIIVEPELSAKRILTVLMDRLIPAFIRMDMPEHLSLQDKKILSLIPTELKKGFDDWSNNNPAASDSERIYQKIRTAIDFISGMTDGHAKYFYQTIEGIV